GDTSDRPGRRGHARARRDRPRRDGPPRRAYRDPRHGHGRCRRRGVRVRGSREPRDTRQDRASADALARCAGPAGQGALGCRGRGPEALPPQLPRVQAGVLPGGRGLGAVRPRYQSVTGTRDLFPSLAERYAATERIARDVFQSYGYGEIRTPIFEHRELFARSVGETTDIVHKEMYEF